VQHGRDDDLGVGGLSGPRHQVGDLGEVVDVRLGGVALAPLFDVSDSGEVVGADQRQHRIFGHSVSFLRSMDNCSAPATGSSPLRRGAPS
jgi:hypothetical protein